MFAKYFLLLNSIYFIPLDSINYLAKIFVKLNTSIKLQQQCLIDANTVDATV